MVQQYENALSWAPIDSIEEGALEQIKDLGSLPFIEGHVRVMPDVHWGNGAPIGTAFATKGAVIPSAVGSDMGCFVGETKVPLLDGTQKTMKSLSENTEPFWVYAIDPETQEVAPALATALKTRENAKLIKVTVAGGDEIECTPDHEFMVLDGTYKKAEDLQYNDSLMPLYRSWDSRDGYEKVSSRHTTYRPTHRLVHSYISGADLQKGYVIHHVNHNHFDNRPENLLMMTVHDHSSHHGKLSGFKNHDPDFQKLRQEGLKRQLEDPVKLAKKKEVAVKNIKKYMAERPEHFKAAVAGNGARGATYLAKYNVSPVNCNVDGCEYVSKNPAVHRWHKARSHQPTESNHKVLSVTPIERRADVYCLQVPGFNNFALAAGVFVHNCGMMAVKTSMTKECLPSDLKPLRNQIERDIPLGPGKANDLSRVSDSTQRRISELEDLLPVDAVGPTGVGLSSKWRKQLGTLGGGNHFIEVTVDEKGYVWGFLHSGSRGVGMDLSKWFIKEAKQLCEAWNTNLPNPNLAFFPRDEIIGTDYIAWLNWAQRYAELNREDMMERVLYAIERHVGPFDKLDEVRCHHNFAQWEHHRGKNLFVTRKGAIEASEGKRGLIPGSMGTASYVVVGKGNESSLCTAPHGAGRRMSRTAARNIFTMDDFERDMEGIEVKWDAEFLDELPGAYKDIDIVMEQSKDLVDIEHVFYQVVNVKGP